MAKSSPVYPSSTLAVRQKDKIPFSLLLVAKVKPPSLSPTLVGVIVLSQFNPSVSQTKCLLIPLTFLFPSIPLLQPVSVFLTL